MGVLGGLVGGGLPGAVLIAHPAGFTILVASGGAVGVVIGALVGMVSARIVARSSQSRAPAA